MRPLLALISTASLGCDPHLSSSGDSIDWALDLVDGADHRVSLDYEVVDVDDSPADGSLTWRLYGSGAFFGGNVAVHVVDSEDTTPSADTEVGEIPLAPDLASDAELFFGGGFDLPLETGRQELHLVLVHDGSDVSLTGDVSLSVLTKVGAPATLTIHGIGYP